MNINLQINGLPEVQALLKKYDGPAFKRAANVALVKVAAAAKADISSAIIARYNIAAADVRASVDIGAVSDTEQALQISVNIFGSPSKRGRSMNVVRFLEKKPSRAEVRRRIAGGTQNQLRFKFVKARGLKTIDGAFLGNLGRTVFQREPGKYMSKRTNKSGHSKHAQAIRPVQMIGISGMFNFNPIRQRVLDTISQTYPTHLRAALVRNTA